MQTRKLTGPLFKRSKYPSGVSGVEKRFYPADRARLMKLLGGATTVHLQGRIYDRGNNSPVLDFDLAEGSFGDEGPFDSPSPVIVSPTAASPVLPWNGSNFAVIPADGTIDLTVKHANLDVVARVSGANTTWVEFEVWYTAVFTS